jgi:uncharacterized protein YbcV (DUF1398 family)
MMNDATATTTAQGCLDAAYAGTMDFPTIVRALIDAGFEGYAIDYRHKTATYFLADERSVQIPLPSCATSVAAEFRAEVVEQAVREAQRNAPDFTYAGFCAKVKAAGCAGYMVSFLGKRVLYFGRTAQTHVEHFPQ